MKECSIYNLKDDLVVVVNHRADIGLWIEIDDVEIITINENHGSINSRILQQLDKTKSGVPYSLEKEGEKFYNKIGYKSYSSFFKSSNNLCISISYNQNIFTITPLEKGEKKAFYPSKKLAEIKLNKDDADKIAGIVVDMFKTERDENGGD